MVESRDFQTISELEPCFLTLLAVKVRKAGEWT